jgi:hypothetical protein
VCQAVGASVERPSQTCYRLAAGQIIRRAARSRGLPLRGATGSPSYPARIMNPPTPRISGKCLYHHRLACMLNANPSGIIRRSWPAITVAARAGRRANYKLRARNPVCPRRTTMTGVALRVWHCLLARRCKPAMLLTVACGRASQQCGSAIRRRLRQPDAPRSRSRPAARLTRTPTASRHRAWRSSGGVRVSRATPPRRSLPAALVEKSAVSPRKPFTAWLGDAFIALGRHNVAAPLFL